MIHEDLTRHEDHLGEPLSNRRNCGAKTEGGLLHTVAYNSGPRYDAAQPV